MPRTAAILKELRRYESRNVTFVDPDGSWPIVWSRAKGMHVWDVEGKRYLDLTAAFGVAAAGHANRRVVRAGQRQMQRLLHAMGDVHPHPLKAELAAALSQITFGRWHNLSLPGTANESSKRKTQPLLGKVIFGNSGFEAVEAALKTALLATGKPGIIAFSGAYHGVGYGTLNVTHRAHFHERFRSQLAIFGRFVGYPETSKDLLRINEQMNEFLEGGRVGAVLVEPIQGRGGIRVPPDSFLPLLRTFCDEHGVLLIVDEIFTGFGRTGAWFACEHAGVVPDLICLGKALTGGFPLSACVGRAELMDAAWPESSGEAIHTSTYLSHPVGCAMALAQINEIRRERLVEQSAALGCQLLDELQAQTLKSSWRNFARGKGLMAGVELRHEDGTPATAPAIGAMKAMLRRGYLLLTEGEQANVLSFTPPLVITSRQIKAATAALGEVLTELSRKANRAGGGFK